MFTCLCSRAIHIEVAHSLDTDSFLLKFWRFIGKRGNIWQMRFDDGSNFVGAVKELQKSLQDINHSRINEYLQMHGADWIAWINNPPMASHMGWVWERQIRTARGILNTLVKTHGKSLHDESLHMLLVEVKAIVNSRPMTTETISNVKSDIPLSPANLLTMKSKVILPPTGCFSSADIYSRKHGRRVQHIANEFWLRWHKEFLRTLQEQKTCKTRRRNFRNGDIVLLKAENHWNHWPIAHIIETFEDKHGVVWTVRLKLWSENNTQWKLVQPMAKIVLLVEGNSLTESQGLNQN